MTASELRTNVDSYVDQVHPARNYAGEAKLRLQGGGDGDDRRAFLFVAKPFPLGGALVLEGVLRLRLVNGWAGTRTLTLSRVTEGWGENGVTWANQPAFSGVNAVAVAITDPDDLDVIEADVSALLQDAADGDGWFGLALVIDVDQAVNFYSSDAPRGAWKPTLTVDYATAPDPPDSLAPSGGQIVSLAKPRLGWQPDDHDEGQAYSQVQIAATAGGFGAPEYDSGKVANADPGWDLAATAYAGVADGATRFWRCRVWNQADQASSWTDVVEFARDAKGVLTVSSPAAAPNDYVEETTPPITWALAGAVQESARVILEAQNAKGLWVERWRRPRTVSAEVTAYVPRDILKSKRKSDGQPTFYRVHVDVWDDVDRRAIAGDPAYSRLTRTFTYERADTPAAVTALTATPEGRVAVTLAWTRAIQPDYFCVKVDGYEAVDRIDPADVAVGGGDYEMTFWGAVPGVDHTYEVEAVVNDAGKLKHSGGNATDQAVTGGGGIWLVDDTLGDQLAVVIATEGSGAAGGAPDLALGESGETITLVGAAAPVRITDAERGYEGTVNGVLMSTAERDVFRELKSRAADGQALRLIVSTLNIPVGLGEAAPSPRSAPGGRYNVGVEVFQVGEFPELD